MTVTLTARRGGSPEEREFPRTGTFLFDIEE